jgi:anti-sigma factor RsiW
VTSELEAKLSALLDGELAPDEAAALREEIARRPELEARLAELAAVDSALRALPGRPLPADLRARLERRLRLEAEALPRRSPAVRRAGRRRRWLAAAALAGAAAALALLVQLRSEEAQVEAEDLPVIAVLDVLTELDELEGAGNG